jgi:hypothetical protein
LNICELDKEDLDRYDMGQGGVKMILVDRYDHSIYFGRKETMMKKKYNYCIKKFPYLNLNVYEVVQEIWEVLLLDRLQ